jgi:hypothetical protein
MAAGCVVSLRQNFEALGSPEERLRFVWNGRRSWYTRIPGHQLPDLSPEA